jgi:DMSO/TMAO reductase YedYZ molybdopterin-dependent catalytic subunit
MREYGWFCLVPEAVLALTVLITSRRDRVLNKKEDSQVATMREAKRKGNMKRTSVWQGGLLGALTALVVVAINVIGNLALGLPRMSYTLFDWVTRLLPGKVVTFFIESMVSFVSRLNLGPTSVVTKQVELTIAVIQFLVLGAVFGILLTLAQRRSPQQADMQGILGGIILAVLILAIQWRLNQPHTLMLSSLLWISLVCILWGWVLAKWIYYLPRRQPAGAEPKAPISSAEEVTRRQFLWVVGIGSFTILASAAGIKLLSSTSSAASSSNTSTTNTTSTLTANVAAASGQGNFAPPPEATLQARIQPAPGTRPELTTNDNFYRVDINAAPPQVDGSTWRLNVTGLVDKELHLSLDDIRLLPVVTQAITLECISNELGGDLTSTALWTGTPFKEVLNQAGIQDNAVAIQITSVDGFFESVPLAEAMDERTILVYEMNGVPLPAGHGYPLRIYIPGHFGMKQPKWITDMEVIDNPGMGYWVVRSWSATAVPPTTSVIDTVASDAPDAVTGAIPVGGIAYSGDRGISKVEVQVDEGDWQAAELRDPPLSSLTWVQWRYDWQPTSGRHTFRVRAYDGTGALQELKSTPPHPDGATGVYQVEQLINTTS